MSFFKPKKILLRHFETQMNNGHILGTKRDGKKVEDCGPSPMGLDLEEVQRRATSGLGGDFIRLPGYPPDDEIVGTTADGYAVPAHVAEMVFNDWHTINEHHGEGAYESVANAAERAVLKVAKQLYRSANEAGK